MSVFQAVFQGAGLWPGWNRVLARSGLILEQGVGVVWPDLGIGFGSDCVLVWNTAGRQAYPQRWTGAGAVLSHGRGARRQRCRLVAVVGGVVGAG